MALTHVLVRDFEIGACVGNALGLVFANGREGHQSAASLTNRQKLARLNQTLGLSGSQTQHTGAFLHADVEWLHSWLAREHVSPRPRTRLDYVFSRLIREGITAFLGGMNEELESTA